MKKYFFTKAVSRRGNPGFALVVVLGFVVLLTVVVLAFFSNALLQRQVSNSSANETRVQLFTQGALDTVVGDLKQEIYDGSTSTTNNGIVTYFPKVATSFRSSYTNMESAFQGFAPAFSSTNQETDGLNNLLKVSSASAFYAGGITRGSSASTTNASLNGRAISRARWNKPLLLTQSNTNSTNDFTPVAVFPSPTWVYVSRSGANPTAWSGSLAASANNTASVIGRYAYTIYNEGGTLDINVAGFPSTLKGSDFEKKRGLLPQVDLASIPGIDSTANANALVQWRNQTTAASGSSYTNAILTETNGFSTVAQGDQTFVSRQSLIKYAQDHSDQIALKALPYLGTFTRELNAPSYFPPQSGSAARPAPNSLVTDNDKFNPNLNLRVTTSFTRVDGSIAQVGDPFIKRFPLSRLAWIGRAGPNGASAAQIQKAFGLVFSTSTKVWTYNHGDPGKILQLSEVAALNREPDFFELLQAGIYVGSLGRTGPNGPDDGAGSLNSFDASSYFQILQIGANLVDQYDTDSYPTRISFNSQDFYGIENLPYLITYYKCAYRFHGSAEAQGVPEADYHPGITDPRTARYPRLGFWYQPAIWNPHANAATFFTTSAYQGPTEFRYTINGWVSLMCAQAHNFDGPDAIISPIREFTDASGPGLQFGNNSAFVQPTVLTSVNAIASAEDNVTDPGATYPAGVSANNGTFIGLHVATVIAPDNRNQPGATYLYNDVTDLQSPNVYHYLEYKDESGNWVPYSVIKNVHNETYPFENSDDFQVRGKNVYPNQQVFLTRIGYDPRVDRFGANVSFTHGGTPGTPGNEGAPGYDVAADTWNNDTFRPLGNTNIENRLFCQSFIYGWSNNYNYFIGLFAENRPDTGTIYGTQSQYAMRYLDPDGIVRPADGAYADPNNLSLSPAGFPLFTDRSAIPSGGPSPSANSRPVILNRPFRSVADMGYASRGMPWKHLDFFTTQSADAGLLDLFCLNESPLVVSGKLDMNTRQHTVVQAVLSGAIISELDNTSVSASGAGMNAASVSATFSAQQSVNSRPVGLADTSSPVSFGPVGPWLNKSQLVTRWIGGMDSSYYTLFGGPAPNNYTPVAASADSIIKRRREAVVRALADVGNTRTWNLLIDVVAQTGRFGSSATSLDQFTVEGERRVWMHVAIDRFTGKVISQYIEPVYE